jgi:hypothetical protein
MFKRSVGVTAILLTTLIAGLFVYGTSRPTTRPVAAYPLAREAESMCVPVSVAVFNDRIHVECLNGAAFRFFAAPLGEPNTTEFLAALTTAMSSIPIMELRVGYYDDTTSGPPFGCGANDCRKISYVVLGLKPGAPMN